MGFLDYFMDTSKLGPRPYRRLLIYFLGLLAIALVSSLIFLFAAERFFFLFLFGFISFWATTGLVFIISAVCGIASQIYLFKYHRQLWKIFMCRPSLKERCQAARDIRSLNDPFLIKTEVWWNKAGLFLFKLWLIVFAFVVVGYLAWHYFFRAR
jgi:hypothetical protein